MIFYLTGAPGVGKVLTAEAGLSILYSFIHVIAKS